MQQAVADLEAVRQTVEAASWMVLGHSWGCDLAVRYALDHPRSVRQVIGVAGHGLHQDRSWSQIYQELKHTEPDVPIAWDPAVHEALQASFREWIHEPALFRRLADSPVPMSFISAAEDVRPSWPLQQLGELVPNGSFQQIPGVPHDLWATHPDEWVDVVTTACRRTIA